MVSRNDDLVAVGFDHSFPPLERLAADHPTRIAAQRAAADLLRWFIDVAHHQEQQVADAERVPLPGAFNRVATAARVDSRVARVLPRRINPFAPPPVLRLVEAAAVMVAADAVDILAAAPAQRAELAYDLLSFVIPRSGLAAGLIAEIEGEVPGEAALL